MKKLFAIILALLVIAGLFFCTRNNDDKKNTVKNITGNSVPNVFGIAYADAVEILEADGYEVKAVETSVKGISEKLLFDFDSVEKGSVFKIDDYILDNLGNLTLNYEILDDESEMFSEDKSIVIYYAKEDYIKEVAEKTDTVSPDENNEAVVDDNTSPKNISKTTDTTIKEPEKKETNNSIIRTDFKAAMDSYEKFFDEYVTIMKKYANNPNDMSILNDYVKYIGEYAQMMEDFEKWENSDMNAAETAYYIEVQGRITNKLLEISQ